MSEEQTEFLRQRYPVVLVIINVVMKRLEMILTNIVTVLAVIYFEQSHVHNQIWNETGQHFQDLVQTNQIVTKLLQEQKQEKEINNDTRTNN